MTQDLERARTLLSENDNTFCAVKGQYVVTSQKRGVAPIIDILGNEPDFLTGASAADKVIGKILGADACSRRSKRSVCSDNKQSRFKGIRGKRDRCRI